MKKEIKRISQALAIVLVMFSGLFMSYDAQAGPGSKWTIIGKCIYELMNSYNTKPPIIPPVPTPIIDRRIIHELDLNINKKLQPMRIHELDSAVIHKLQPMRIHELDSAVILKLQPMRLHELDLKRIHELDSTVIHKLDSMIIQKLHRTDSLMVNPM
ncbi:MAG: hypothetical protein E7115_08820 [Bacteroidales bacterium]|nr:hypothetical protein [Bacteroidales bacterium]